MPTATVLLLNPSRIEFDPRQMIDCAVRVNMQGYGSVELCTNDLGIFPTVLNASAWHTLEDVLQHSDVRAVTFRGPWTE